MASKGKGTTDASPPSNSNLPKRWHTVRFGDVVRDVNESERNPLDAGLERYVGLEHIEPENLHLKQWGMLADSEISFRKRFRKGQVLFGKRRAYQRKVAVAQFDGICSSDILTFEPKGDALIPELLPFIVQSDGFFKHALGTSSGSLSPRTRWSQLQDYQFPLPPKGEQRRIADILWAADEACERWIAVLANIETLIDKYRATLFESHEWQQVPLGELFEIKLGKMLSPKARNGLSPFPYVGNLNVQWGHVSVDNVQFMDFEGEEISRFRLRKGDLLVCEGGEVGRAAIWEDQLPECYYQKAIHRLRPFDERAVPEFILQFFFYAAKRGLFKGLTGHSTIAHLTAVKLRTLKVALPPLVLQRTFVKFLQDLLENKLRVTGHLTGCKQLKRTLMTVRMGNIDVH